MTIFTLAALGFLSRRIGLVSEKGQSSFNNLVIYMILPANILRAFLNSGVEGNMEEYVIVLLVSAVIQALCVPYGSRVFHRYSEDRQKSLRYGTICSNASFLGNPAAECLYGAEGVILANLYLIPQRIMMWSLGLAVFSGTSDKKEALKKVLTHPCILASVLGLALMLTRVTLPEELMGAINAMGNCCTTASMMAVGMSLNSVKLRELWDPAALLYSLHRLIIIPLIVYLVCLFLHISGIARGLSLILAAMPAGATTSILAEKYNAEPAFATRLVVLSTLLSIPTIAVWMLILE